MREILGVLEVFSKKKNQSENSRRLWLSKIPCWKSFPANFGAAGKLFPDFPAARNAIPVKAWALSGNENGCLRERCQEQFRTFRVPHYIQGSYQNPTVKDRDGRPKSPIMCACVMQLLLTSDFGRNPDCHAEP